MKQEQDAMRKEQRRKALGKYDSQSKNWNRRDEKES